jgi:molecular chaperone Hsp33
MHDRDCLHRFLFEHYPIRGHIVHLDAAWRALLEHRDYPPAIRDTLGEAVAASVLLAATLKFDGTLSLQMQGQGPMHLMLAQCSSELGVRAVARYREAPDGRDLAALSGEGNLTVTLENEDLSQRYQGVVPLSGERLAECLRGYFETSEQLPTRLWLHATDKGASGLLLQRLSDDSVHTRTGIKRPFELPERDEIDDAWRRVQLLGDTLRGEELQTRHPAAALRRGRCAAVPVIARVFPLPLLARPRRRHAPQPRCRRDPLGTGRARRGRGPVRLLQPGLSLRSGRRRAAVRDDAGC